jgi:hypothetical protein
LAKTSSNSCRYFGISDSSSASRGCGAVKVEFGGLLKGETGSRDGALDEAVPVMVSDVVEQGDVRETSHERRDETIRSKQRCFCFTREIFRLSGEMEERGNIPC